MEVDEEEDEYMSGYLNKKEDGNKWVLYWVVLTDRLLKHFKVCHNYDYDDTEECSLVGWTEVTPQTKCILGKKKDNGYLFYIEKRGKYGTIQFNSISIREIKGTMARGQLH